MAGRRRLLRGALAIACMDDAGSEPRGADIAIEGGVIVAVGQGLRPEGAEIVDVSGCVVTPGLVNTHHHLFQALTRAVPGAEAAPLFGWLRRLYPIWARFTPEDFALSAQAGLAELALSGCTMTSDHQYLFPNGARLDDTIEAARAVGLRFHACRGSMSIGESVGGLPPDDLVEDEEAILADCERLIGRWHDPAPGAMVRVALAPCSPFSVSRGLMRESAELARRAGVRLHTHLAENAEDVAYSLERFGCRPGQYAEELGWLGEDVWHAHCVKLERPEIARFAQTGTGVAHCPCSNCRLGSGIAPVVEMLRAGVRVGLGVDGSASNDSAHLLGEARQAMLLQRVANGAEALHAREALALATRGGAQVLGRGDCGVIAPGMRADLAIWDVATLAAAGAWDPVAALVLTGPHRVRDLIVEGRDVVRGGRLLTLDTRALAEAMGKAARRLAEA